MFSQGVSRLECFPKSFMGKACIRYQGMDDSLFMTAAILLYNRVENFKLTCTIASKDEVDEISLNPDVFSFHWFERVESNPDELLKPYKGNFKSIEKLPTHEKFLSDQLKQPIFIRIMPHENTVCIFTTRITYPVWHCVPFFMSKFFPIFKEKPLTKEETSFLETLTYKMNGNYVTKLTELANSTSFRSYLLKEQLAAFEKKLFEKKVEAARMSLNSLEAEMEQALEAYRKACSRRIEALALVNGLETMANNTEEHTELQDYLTSNPRICCVTLNDSRISFIAKTFLAPHHIEEWETMSKKNRMFDKYETAIHSSAEIKLLLDAIFSENRCLKLKMCAYFCMDYFGSAVGSQSRYNYKDADPTLKDYIPNPHLYHHNCFGQNKTAILTQLMNGDAIGAIECCIACAQRVNIHESMSFDPFVRDLLGSTGKCLVAEDGTEMTVREAIAYLKGQSNE